MNGEKFSRRDLIRFRAALNKKSIDAMRVDVAAVGARIRKIRIENLGLTQKGLGDLIHATETNISNWENGTSLVKDVTILCRIAALGCCTVDWLLTGDDYVISSIRGATASPYTSVFIPPTSQNVASAGDGVAAVYYSMVSNSLKEKKDVKRGKTRGKTTSMAK